MARRFSARFLFLAWALVRPSALTRGLEGARAAAAAAVALATTAAGVLAAAAGRLPDGAADPDAVAPLLPPDATSLGFLPVEGVGPEALVLRCGFTLC